MGFYRFKGVDKIKLKTLICGIIVLAVLLAGGSIAAFSQDEAPPKNAKKTVYVNMEDNKDMSEEEHLSEMIEFYRAKVEGFDPGEGEISTYEELFAYLETLPGHIDLSDLEEGESRLVEVLDDGSEIYVKAVPSGKD